MSAKPTNHHPTSEPFQLENGVPANDGQIQDFELEAVEVGIDGHLQGELYLPTDSDVETPETTPQLELAGMAKPVYAITLETGEQAQFQHADSLLESLESQNIDAHFQCREGYCGSCRAQLLEGNVHYTSEPLAWLNEGEILLCCCIPRSHLKLKLNP